MIHDHLAQDGGAEKVLRVFADMYPEAPIYTLLFEKENVHKNFRDRHIETSIIQRLPGGVKHYKWYLFFMPMAVEFFDLRGYDLVISDASAFAKGVITSPDTLHICYCHTPTRYLWSDAHQYLNELKYNKFFKKIISLTLGRLRLWDFAAAARVDHFIANSKTVQRRITKYYRRESQVIYPPVETDRFKVADISGQSTAERYFLIGCRLAPYKRVDIVVSAFKALGAGYNLKIFGDGVDMARLKKLAGDAVNIEFLGRVSNAQKAELYSHCLAFINPQEEDFGITVVEALASGRPVIAYRAGGATETVLENESGVFFNEQTPQAIMTTVRRFMSDIDTGVKVWNGEQIREGALKYSVEKFRQQIADFIAEKKSQSI